MFSMSSSMNQAFVSTLEDALSVDEDLERLRVAWKPRQGASVRRRDKVEPFLAAVPEDDAQTAASGRSRTFGGGDNDAERARQRLARVAPTKQVRSRLVEQIVEPRTPARSVLGSSLGDLASEFEVRRRDSRKLATASRTCESEISFSSTSRSASRYDHEAHTAKDGQPWEAKLEEAQVRRARDDARRCAWEEAVSLRSLRLGIARRHAAGALAAAAAAAAAPSAQPAPGLPGTLRSRTSPAPARAGRGGRGLGRCGGRGAPAFRG